MEQLKAALEKAISEVSNFSKFKSHIVMMITSKGLRIELMESGRAHRFQTVRARGVRHELGIIFRPR